ncbi:adenosylcobinamide-GDP ribazoletransferase [Actinoplanes octamycinicus]|uniref:Adenosylcobinamide-GDP ribazoletransferase n=1 Tax=Actinoplanes octamycinicus TaxID=135948 RepID=A0A7W7GWY5_9ACTN|nr:adenosylcobinamide-GDP ribazoletransferase [Actinoplanes octamycinicus]MBB4739687.1 adenosylcobinamide-GDP ribazoletransferase [Actinoplanes octamycinicus]GIE54871.1 adenosylcobinamide-GDP ribazoletransferase [Actinoplanes octamycinicus]
MIDGLRLAVTTLTVLPVRGGRVDRAAAAVAMGLAPLIGALLGLALAALHEGLRALGAPALVAAGVTVAAGALLTRGLHLDGLADTVDALGSYRSGPAALEIMKKPDIGPFGVVALAAAVLVQAAALTAVTWWALVIAWTTGRLAITVACRRGVPPARPDGLGAMVAGTVPLPATLLAAALVAAAAIPAVPDRPWQGPVAVAVAVAAVLILLRHCVRRLGGITGDVLGACVETAVTIALITLSVR